MANPLSIDDPSQAAVRIAGKLKARRLDENLSRKTLAERSGVPEATIKHFETTGQIALVSLLKLAFVLDNLEDFDGLFQPKPVLSIDQISRKPRVRGTK